jgi:hypothetical protein
MATNPTGTAPSLVTRAKNIILSPKTEWPVIDAEPATVGGLYRNYIIILAAIPPLAMAIGLLLFGINLIIVTVRPSATYILANAITQYVMGLVGVYVLALIIEALAPTFGGTKNRIQALKVAAYSYTPAWIAGILLLMPSLALLVMLASLYCLYLLYLGLPVLMKSSPDKKGVYLAAVIVAAIVIGLVAAVVTSAVTRAFTPMPTLTAPAGYTLPG